MKNKKCHNCKHAGQQFKIAGKTHLHCRNPVKYPKPQEAESAWETLRFFADSCELHEMIFLTGHTAKKNKYDKRRKNRIL